MGQDYLDLYHNRYWLEIHNITDTVFFLLYYISGQLVEKKYEVIFIIFFIFLLSSQSA